MVQTRNGYRNETSSRRTSVSIPEHKLKESAMSPPRSIQPISSEVNLDEANQIAIILFFCLTHIVTPALKAFLCDNGLQLPATIDYDYAKMVRRIDINRKRMADFLDASYSITSATFRKAINARNDICHLKYLSLSEHWKQYTSVWRTLCLSIGNPEAAVKVQVIYNFLIMREYRGAIENQVFLLTSQDYNVNVGFGLGCILFGCLTKYVAPSLRNFLIDEKNQSTSTALDAFDNLKHVISEQKCDSNYLSKGGDIRNDIALLKLSMKARNNSCHGFFSLVFQYWENYLEAWIQLMEIINARTASAEMQGILETLMTSMNENQQIHLANVLSWLTNPVIPDILTDTL